MDNPEKRAAQGTQDEDQQNKENNKKQYVLDTTIAHTNTNNLNTTSVLLQTTGGKD